MDELKVPSINKNIPSCMRSGFVYNNVDRWNANVWNQKGICVQISFSPVTMRDEVDGNSRTSSDTLQRLHGRI